MYELQSAQRLADSLKIDMVHNCIWGDNLDHDDPSNSNNTDDTTSTESAILKTSGQATIAIVTCVFEGPCATSWQYKWYG